MWKNKAKTLKPSVTHGFNLSFDIIVIWQISNSKQTKSL